MKVFKFGGASVKDAEGIKNVASIIQKYGEKNLVVVVSATGKTTNALEAVVNAYFKLSGAEAIAAFEIVKENHNKICKDLFENDAHEVFDKLENIYAEVAWQLEEERKETYNYVYDQVVSQGELISSVILSTYLNEVNVKNKWLDVRDVMKTDETYREAVVDQEKTQSLINSVVIPVIKDGIIVTQGFIGSTAQNCTTTLGREGSDYTAAIFANMLNAESQTIWKDVPGVMNGDPRVFDDAVFIDEISFNEAVEMTFYGATVIHPKTIKPLQNKNIPLLVKSFIHPEGKGTTVGGKDKDLPPVRIVKDNQALITLHTKDFSFVEDGVVAQIFSAFFKANLKLNMMQQGAISFEAVVDNIPEKIEKIKLSLQDKFDFVIDENLTILTIRHYTGFDYINKFKNNKTTILEQRRPSTYQGLLA
ncbi:MAG: lysC [Bacteroidota bacterium]|nr:lysC [Bacteroidota bacterium]